MMCLGFQPPILLKAGEGLATISYVTLFEQVVDFGSVWWDCWRTFWIL